MCLSFLFVLKNEIVTNRNTKCLLSQNLESAACILVECPFRSVQQHRAYHVSIFGHDLLVCLHFYNSFFIRIFYFWCILLCCSDIQSSVFHGLSKILDAWLC